MWIGAIKLIVWTKDVKDAGTDDTIVATLLRDDDQMVKMTLDWPHLNDLERGHVDIFTYTLRSYKPEDIKGDVARPGRGVEYYGRPNGRLKLRLETNGQDLWIKDRVELHIKELNWHQDGNKIHWTSDKNWKFLGAWDQDRKLSRDSREGTRTNTMKLV